MKLLNILKEIPHLGLMHCMKSVCIRSYSGPYSVQIWGKVDQNNSEHGYFLRSDALHLNLITSVCVFVKKLIDKNFQ